MSELRFSKKLYEGEQVDAAVKVYERYGEFSLEDDGTHWVVQVKASTPERTRRLEGELANYALGSTIRARSGS